MERCYGLSMHGDVFPQVLTSEDDESRLADVPKAMKLLGGITRQELNNMRRRGELESIKLGRRRMYYRASIDALIDKKLEEARAESAK